MNHPEQAPQLQSACRNLRSKEMYHQPPEQQTDSFDSGLCWCLHTHEIFGPDGQPAGSQECRPGRACYQG